MLPGVAPHRLPKSLRVVGVPERPDDHPLGGVRVGVLEGVGLFSPTRTTVDLTTFHR